MRPKKREEEQSGEERNESQPNDKQGVTAAYRPAHRRFLILEIVYNTEGKVRTGDLAQRFGVGHNLLAHDLKILEDMGLVERGHGWVRRRATELEDLFQKTEYAARERRNPEAKEAIARYIVQNLIEEGDDVVLDAGTTAFEVGRQLFSLEKKVVVTTNNLPLMLFLAGHTSYPLYLAGGSYSRAHAATVGREAADFVETRMANVGVFTPRSLALVDPSTAQAADRCGPAVERALEQLKERLGDEGAVAESLLLVNCFEEDPLQFDYKEALIKNANRLVVAADYSKWTLSGRDFFVLLCLLGQTLSAAAAPIRTRGPVRTRGAVAQLVPPRSPLELDVRDPVDLRVPGTVTIVTSERPGGGPPEALKEMVQMLLPAKGATEFLERLEEVVVVVDLEGRPTRWTRHIK